MARPANPELRDKILKAAAEIIEGCGPDCVTMREVAERVGYSTTTLYLYFKDKTAILQQAVLLAFDDMNEAASMAMVGPTALDEFRQRCRSYVVWGLMHRGHYTLMFQLPWDMEWTVSFDEETLGRLMRGRIADLALLERAIADGELAAGTDVARLEDAVWAGLHGATSLAVAGRLGANAPDKTPADLVALATRVSDDLVNALIAVHTA